MTKLTYVEAIDLALNGNVNEEVAEKLEALKAQLVKRGSAKKGMTKTQKENDALKDRIAEILTNGGMTATELANELGVSCQKVSALLKQMVEANEVTRVKEGKAIRFELL